MREQSVFVRESVHLMGKWWLLVALMMVFSGVAPTAGAVVAQPAEPESAGAVEPRCPLTAYGDAVCVVFLTQRSRLYARDFRFDDAIADINAAIALATTSNDLTVSDEYVAHLYFERAQRVLLLYEWDAVLADYNRAIDLDPDYAEAYYHRGILYYTQGPRERAVPDFERYLELAPDGQYADEARASVESIAIELDALNRD